MESDYSFLLAKQSLKLTSMCLVLGYPNFEATPPHYSKRKMAWFILTHLWQSHRDWMFLPLPTREMTHIKFDPG